jgi:hypothetical protein
MKVKNILSSHGNIIAMIIKKQDVQSLNFITPETFPLQLGISNYKRGSMIRPHTHNRIKRTVDISQEMVYVEKGRVRVHFYDNKGKEVHLEVLESGDIVFFASGGHGFDILVDTKIVEVKQGPFYGTEKEKTFLDSDQK